MSIALLANSPSMPFVVCLGLGTVFVGLICIIIICYVMGIVVRLIEKPKAEAVTTPAPAMTADDLSVTNRGEFIAAVSAAIAEESGTDASGIRIVSLKKL